MNKQLMREIEEIRVPELFIAYHGNGKESHTITRHMFMSRRDLVSRLCSDKAKEEGVRKASRFLSDNLVDVVSHIHQCLIGNFHAVEKWVKEDNGYKLELSFDFDFPIGECIVKGTDWRTAFQESRIIVVLLPSKRRTRLFQVWTAYPELNLDETDLVYDAMDEYRQKKAAGKRR